MKKIALLLLFLLLAGGGYFWWAKPKIVPLQTEAPTKFPESTKVERRTMAYDITGTGDLTPAFQVEVKAEISGPIKRITYGIGDRVKKGDLLLELDDRDLLTEKKRSLTDIEGTQLTLDKTKRNFDRAKKLFDRNLLSRELFENAKTEFDTAQNDFEKAKSQLQVVVDKLAKTKIPAPMDGTVLALPVVEGQVVVGAGSVNNGTSLMTIADLNRMIISTHINQVDISKLQVNQAVQIRVDSVSDAKMQGVISLISPLATIKNSVKGFTVTVLIKNLDPRLRPGMTADLTFPITSVENALSIPLSAIFTEDDEQKVVYVAGATPEAPAHKQAVTLGLITVDYAEVKAGLKEGDIILLSRPRGLKGS